MDQTLTKLNLQEFLDWENQQPEWRGADGLFTLHNIAGREQVRLDTVGCKLRASDVIDGVGPEVGEQIGLPV